MKRSTLYILAIIILLLLNLGLIALLLLGPQHRPPHGKEEAAQYIIRELKLDESQQQAFAELRREHQAYIKPLHDTLMIYRDRLYSAAAYADSSLARQYALKIGGLHTGLDWYTYDHFRKVKMLCRPEQEEKFDGIIREALKMMAPGRPPGKGPH